jgi:hypothetical protein
MDPFDLTVYNSPFVKKRIGKNNDGGYIICDIPNAKYELLISGGISDDISFEEQLLQKYRDLKCFAFDGTINSINLHDPNIFFIKKNIGCDVNNDTTNLLDLIEKYNNIFLKMDIEGAELPWLNFLTEEQIAHFSQIVIEFHFPFSEKDKNVFKKINKTHLLMHLHGNNCPAGVVNHKNIVIPNVFECTYVNKKYIDTIELNTSSLPSIIDMPNCGGNDIDLNYPPFVNI